MLRVFGPCNITCISLQDEIIEGAREKDTKGYAPVVQSNLKFAAHGCKFLMNYKENLPKFIKRINDMLFDSDEDKEKVEKFKNYLAEVDVKHMTVVFGLLDVYTLLSIAQHGVSKVNQFP